MELIKALSDSQIEGILLMLAGANSGGDLLHGAGSTYNAIAMSAEMMVIHSGWLEAARYLGRGIQVDEVRLCVANLDRVGSGGSFMTDDLTVQLLRGDEFFRSEVFDYASGAAAPEVADPGCLSLLERARAGVGKLGDGCQSPLQGRVQENIRRYFSRRYRELGVKP